MVEAASREVSRVLVRLSRAVRRRERGTAMGMAVLRQRVRPRMWRRSGGGCALLWMRQAAWPVPCSSALGCWDPDRCVQPRRSHHTPSAMIRSLFPHDFLSNLVINHAKHHGSDRSPAAIEKCQDDWHCGRATHCGGVKSLRGSLRLRLHAPWLGQHGECLFTSDVKQVGPNLLLMSHATEGGDGLWSVPLHTVVPLGRRSHVTHSVAEANEPELPGEASSAQVHRHLTLSAGDTRFIRESAQNNTPLEVNIFHRFFPCSSVHTMGLDDPRTMKCR